MAVNRFVLATGVALALLVAGCLGGDDAGTAPSDRTDVGEPTPAPTQRAAPACTTSVDGLNAHAAAGQLFTFDIVNDCEADWQVQEISAYYATRSSATASRDSYTGSCVPASVGDGGRQTTSCSLLEPGTYYVRARATATNGADATESWSNEYIVSVYSAVDSPPLAGASVTSLQDVPSRPLAGTPFDVHLAIGWATAPPGLESDQISIRWARESSVNPTLEAYPRTCSVANGVVPGEYDISCAFPTAGTYYLRGWARTGDVSPVDHWSRELATEVR